MTGSGNFVEVQGTAEHQAFDRAELNQLLDLASLGISRINDAQREVLATPPAPRAS
jgi:ribonuclease PH